MNQKKSETQKLKQPTGSRIVSKIEAAAGSRIGLVAVLQNLEKNV